MNSPFLFVAQHRRQHVPQANPSTLVIKFQSESGDTLTAAGQPDRSTEVHSFPDAIILCPLHPGNTCTARSSASATRRASTPECKAETCADRYGPYQASEQ